MKQVNLYYSIFLFTLLSSCFGRNADQQKEKQNELNEKQFEEQIVRQSEEADSLFILQYNAKINWDTLTYSYEYERLTRDSWQNYAIRAHVSDILLEDSTFIVKLVKTGDVNLSSLKAWDGRGDITKGINEIHCRFKMNSSLFNKLINSLNDEQRTSIGTFIFHFPSDEEILAGPAFLKEPIIITEGSDIIAKEILINAELVDLFFPITNPDYWSNFSARN